MPEPGYRVVTTTTDAREAASALARSSVEARLAACAQVLGPIESTYRWDGTVEVASEYLVVLKTTTDRVAALQEHLLARHTYDVPEVIVTEVTGGNPAYLRWLDTETATEPTRHR